MTPLVLTARARGVWIPDRSDGSPGAECAEPSGHPVIYEINSRVWLNDLSRRHARPVTLADVPAAEWNALADLGVDTVWLMGVWERSPSLAPGSGAPPRTTASSAPSGTISPTDAAGS